MLPLVFTRNLFATDGRNLFKTFSFRRQRITYLRACVGRSAIGRYSKNAYKAYKREEVMEIYDRALSEWTGHIKEEANYLLCTIEAHYTSTNDNCRPKCFWSNTQLSSWRKQITCHISIHSRIFSLGVHLTSVNYNQFVQLFQYGLFNCTLLPSYALSCQSSFYETADPWPIARQMNSGLLIAIFTFYSGARLATRAESFSNFDDANKPTLTWLKKQDKNFIQACIEAFIVFLKKK